MRVGVDFSGVVIDSDAAKVATARQFLGLELNPANTLYTAAGTPMAAETRTDLLALLFCTSRLFMASPLPGAVEGLLTLRARGVELAIVSNINHAGVSFAKQWLRMHGIYDVEFISVGIGVSKSMWLEHKFDIFIDDKLSNLVDIQDAVPHKILFTHSYNNAAVLPTGVSRAGGWNEVYRQIMERL